MPRWASSTQWHQLCTSSLVSSFFCFVFYLFVYFLICACSLTSHYALQEILSLWMFVQSIKALRWCATQCPWWAMDFMGMCSPRAKSTAGWDPWDTTTQVQVQSAHWNTMRLCPLLPDYREWSLLADHSRKPKKTHWWQYYINFWWHLDFFFPFLNLHCFVHRMVNINNYCSENEKVIKLYQSSLQLQDI